MVGEGVLHECLLNDKVSEILSISRKDCGVTHPKFKQILIPDFFDLLNVENELKRYDTCFFCLGSTSIGITEEEYTRFTYNLTLHFAKTLAAKNPNMVFSYISGYGTDSTEKGKSMWARVKGKTENDLMKLPFRQVFNFRPSYLHPTKGLKNTLGFYKWIKWVYPFMRFLAPQWACTLKELGLAMINSAINGYDKKIIEVKDIVKLAK